MSSGSVSTPVELVGIVSGTGQASGDGATFRPNVSPDGVISWTNDKGLPNPAPVSIKGPQGMQGETGPAGADGQQGEQGETGPTGVTGPKGEQGETGPTGVTGPKGEQGETGPTGAAGPQGERGETGPTGVAGPKGEQGEIGPTGADGADGADGKSAFASAVEAGYTGTEADFYAALLRMPQAITSTSIAKNEVVTQVQYDALRVLGKLEPETAYDIIED